MHTSSSCSPLHPPLSGYNQLLSSEDVLHSAISLPPLGAVQAARILTRAATPTALPLLTSWQLEPGCERNLTREHGGAPPAGWNKLLGVLAGTGLIYCNDNGFFAVSDEADWSDAQIERALIESFTVRFCPPLTAAGLLLACGIRPVSGLHIAQCIYTMLRKRWEQRPDSALVEDMTAQLALVPQDLVVSRHLFGLLGCMLEVLASLNSLRTYSFDAFANFVGEATLHTYQKLGDELTPEAKARFLDDEESPEQLHPFVRRHLIQEFTQNELFQSFLIPAGLILPVGSTRFMPNTDRLRAGFDLLAHPTPLARSTNLIELLTTHTPNPYA